LRDSKLQVTAGVKRTSRVKPDHSVREIEAVAVAGLRCGHQLPRRAIATTSRPGRARKVYRTESGRKLDHKTPRVARCGASQDFAMTHDLNGLVATWEREEHKPKDGRKTITIVGPGCFFRPHCGQTDRILRTAFRSVSPVPQRPHPPSSPSERPLRRHFHKAYQREMAPKRNLSPRSPAGCPDHRRLMMMLNCACSRSLS